MGKRTRSHGVYRGSYRKGENVKEPQDDDPVYGAVDHFMKGADEVRFDDNDSSSEDGYDVTNTKHHVMQLSKDRDMSDSSDDLQSDDSSSDEDQKIRSKRQEQRIEEKYEEWGRLEGRNKYHGTDIETNHEGYDAALQEEEEAIYLQEKQVSNLKHDDFAVENDEESDSEDEFWDEAEQKENFQQAAKAIEGVSLIPGKHVEKTKKRKSSAHKLSKEQKLEVIEKDSPELLGLLKDFENKLAELKNNVQPLLTEVVKKELPTSDGISFLEAKFHLLLNYCLNIGFYMLLKAEGQQVQDHPVISQLVKLRLLLDKIKPIDQKLHYQVQKLLKMSAGGSDQQQIAEGLQHRPNLDALESRDDDDDAGNAGIYKPMKIAPVHYDGEDDLIHGKKKRTRKVKSDTAMAAFVREEFSEAPREISFSGRPTLTKEQKHEIEFEEENFMRLTKQAKARRKQEKQLLQRSELEDPLDFRDITGFGQMSDDEDISSRNKLHSIINSVERQGPSSNPEIDLPYNTWDKRQPLNKRSFSEFKSQQQEEEESSDGEDTYGKPMQDDSSSAEDVSEDEYYEKMKQAKKKRRINAQEDEDEDEELPNYRDDTLRENSKRGLTFQIENNKGLTRQRPKSKRNPRVRYRVKAEKANKKLKTTGHRQVRDQFAPYGGEATGIRKKAKRSTNLK